MLRSEQEQRFWSRVAKEPSGCWNWTGPRWASGRYGQVKIRELHDSAHRVAFMFTRGEIPEGLFVCHRCDNPLCCKPSHLFLGTPKDNVHDMMAKGRALLVGRPRLTTARCQNGHALTPGAVAFRGEKRYRRCKECQRANSRRYKERNRGAVQC